MNIEEKAKRYAKQHAFNNSYDDKSYQEMYDLFIMAYTDAYTQAITDLSAENEKLREALSLVEEINDWASATFPKQTSLSKIFHLQDEAKELEMAIKANDSENIKEEFADVFILLVNAAHVQGLSFDDLIESAREKLEVNKKRQWNNPNNNGVCYHKPNN